MEMFFLVLLENYEDEKVRDYLKEIIFCLKGYEVEMGRIIVRNISVYF